MTSRGKLISSRNRLFAAIAALGLAVGAVVALAPTALAAGPARSCVYIADNTDMSCYRTPKEAEDAAVDIANTTKVKIDAVVHTAENFAGDALWILSSKPCPKNNLVDHFITLEKKLDYFANNIRSVQPWAKTTGCWVWLYATPDHREGPYKVDTGSVGNQIKHQIYLIGLS